jgi:Peptidase C10 family/Spi protease inhibitor/Secretion system C-terminal sorting domain
MKKIFNLFLLLFSLLQFSAIAKEVPVEQAKKVAQNYFSFVTARQSSNLVLAHTALMANGKPSLYVFQNTDGVGFVLVSGDDIAEPVLGYSSESTFDLNTKNKAFLSWMEFYQNEIAYGISKNYTQPAEIKVKWNQYASNNFAGSDRAAGVQPLVKSKWGQDPDENAQCPLDKEANKRCVTGCPATAVAMIMKYHKHPAQGIGNSSYNHEKYGTLAVNYADQTYNYANMPDSITGPNDDLAKLMYHAGVAVEMGYTPTESGSFVIEAYCNKKEATCEYAFKNYFGYDKTTVAGIQKKDFTDAVWLKKLKDELDAQRPMQYAGFGGGGHTWVCDGYDDNNKFHMNWGWRGQQDGYYALNALSPGSGGTGSGEGSYNNGQQAIVGIKPAVQQLSSAPKFGLVLNSGITLNPAILKANAPNTPFTVTLDLNYTGTTTLEADLAASIFTEDGDFIDYVEIQEKQSFTDKTTKKYTFSSKGLDLVQGNYTIGIYSAGLKDSSWTLVKKSNFTNPIKFKVEGAPALLSLAAATKVPPAAVLENTNFSVTMSVKNEGTTTYDGYVVADVYDKDNDYKMSVGAPSKVKIDAGKSQDITFTSTNSALKQGTYLVVAAESLDDKEYRELSNKNFENPVKMIVIETPIKADAFENNNTAAVAAALTPNFVNNVATIQTTGSNLHVANDLDHYGITLPTGYNYTINARVNDEKNAIDGKKYTTDVVMSYIVNSTNSPYYDESLPAPVKIDKGGNIIFKIAPTFVGFTGTYVLDVNIARTPTTATNETFEQSNIDIYPNPASQYLTIDRSKSEADIVAMVVYNSLGQKVKMQSMQAQDKVSQVDVSDLNNGVYFVQLFDAKHNSYTTQFLIQN